MTTLLRVDSSPFPGEASFSRQLTSEFTAEWRKAHAGGRVSERDLAKTSLAPLTPELIAAMYTPESSRTPEQNALLTTSDELIAELQTADEYVFGVSMHNFSIPSSLKLWIDQVARAGKTFSYQGGGPKGLLNGKKATFLVASGGVYEPGTAMAAFNHIEPYLRSVFAFLGVKDVTFINAGGTARARSGVDRATILQPALESIHAQFQAA
ncbi:MAG TPA: NAD(P)H-dependent oxidoreductase [Bryobacteraceae bacterium]|nr:NAD(P)H-dependent oxidoreductase [Bryobacteraceae bacterium]